MNSTSILPAFIPLPFDLRGMLHQQVKSLRDTPQVLPNDEAVKHFLETEYKRDEEDGFANMMDMWMQVYRLIHSVNHNDLGECYQALQEIYVACDVTQDLDVFYVPLLNLLHLVNMKVAALFDTKYRDELTGLLEYSFQFLFYFFKNRENEAEIKTLFQSGYLTMLQEHAQPSMADTLALVLYRSFNAALSECGKVASLNAEMGDAAMLMAFLRFRSFFLKPTDVSKKRIADVGSENNKENAPNENKQPVEDKGEGSQLLITNFFRVTSESEEDGNKRIKLSPQEEKEVLTPTVLTDIFPLIEKFVNEQKRDSIELLSTQLESLSFHGKRSIVKPRPRKLGPQPQPGGFVPRMDKW